MTAPTWVDAAEAMLEGAAMTAPAKFSFWRDAKGRQTVDRAAVRATCARGAVLYVLGVEEECEVALTDLARRYVHRFYSGIIYDNDRYGRDYVLANVKELLNEAAAEATT